MSLLIHHKKYCRQAISCALLFALVVRGVAEFPFSRGSLRMFVLKSARILSHVNTVTGMVFLLVKLGNHSSIDLFVLSVLNTASNIHRATVYRVPRFWHITVRKIGGH